MSQASKRRPEPQSGPVRVLGRGLRAQRGVHLTLRALREGVGKTQIEVRESSHIDQADISRLESRESFDEYQVSTLQRYLSALGGHLELVAVFGDKKIILAGVQPTRLADGPANTALQRTGRRPTRP
jgi:transcriptional regulator with XRE-family HTH domain